jgi:hypothetical protein
MFRPLEHYDGHLAHSIHRLSSFIRVSKVALLEKKENTYKEICLDNTVLHLFAIQGKHAQTRFNSFKLVLMWVTFAVCRKRH